MLDTPRQSRARLTHKAHHDTLTGLPDRTLFLDRLEQAILQCRRYRRRITLIDLDLENVKQINDSLGHGAGDLVLEAKAARMLECVRDADTVARLGGDEFAIILFDQPHDPQCVLNYVQRLQSAMATPLLIGEDLVSVDISIGAATFPGDGRNAEELLANADAAMYASKAEGRNHFRFFIPGLTPRARDRMQVQEVLHG